MNEHLGVFSSVTDKSNKRFRRNFAKAHGSLRTQKNVCLSGSKRQITNQQVVTTATQYLSSHGNVFWRTNSRRKMLLEKVKKVKFGAVQRNVFLCHFTIRNWKKKKARKFCCGFFSYFFSQKGSSVLRGCDFNPRTVSFFVLVCLSIHNHIFSEIS